MDASGRGGALARREPVGDAFVDVNGYLECCKDAVSHLESSLSQDKAFPPRWPFEPSPTAALYRKEEDRGNPVLQQARHVPFPPSLVERHRNAPIDYWRMGIFAEICRVWVVLEHRLYLWNYMEDGGTDIIELETPLQERIFGVGLAAPPPGLFNDNVRRVLVIVTPTYVLLHQVVFSTPLPHDEIRIVPTDYYVKSDDLCGVGVPHPLHQPKVLIASTESGRIFLCGQDATVHEFLYPPDAGLLGGWIPSAKCRKVSHFEGMMDRKRWVPPMVSRLIVGDEEAVVCLEIDDTRKRLYTLSSNSYVTVYSIEGSPNSAASVVARGAVLVNRRPAPPGTVVGIRPIPKRGGEGQDRTQPDFVCFLAQGEVISYRVDSRRRAFSEISRIAPDTSAQGSGAVTAEAMEVNVVHYSSDMVLLAHNGNYLDRAGRAAAGRPAADGYTHRNDAILHCVHATGHDRLRPRPPGHEVRPFALSQHPLVNSGVLALAEVPMELIIPRKLHAMVATEWSLPELASQATLASMIAEDGRDASRWILALSKAGLHCFVKARPIDQFRSALAASQGSDAHSLMTRAPLESFSKEEMYCMLLQLACEGGPLSAPPSAAGSAGTDIREQALHLFMTDAPDLSQAMLANQQAWNPNTSSPGGWQQQSAGGWQQPTGGLWGSFGQAADRVKHVSDRHKAVACYLARILRPIMDKKMSEIYLLEPYKKDVLRSVQQRLCRLRLLLESMPSLERPQLCEPHRLKGPDSDRPRSVPEEEKIQMTKLFFVVRRAEEACERLQGDAQRFHAKVGADEARRDWAEWEGLTFKELVVEEKGQLLFYKVHRHLFLNELQGMDETEAHRLLQLPHAGSDARSTFWGSWVQRRLQAERYLQLARARVEQGHQSEGKEQLRLALTELQAVVQEDRAYSHEDLRAHCNLLIEFNFYECYEGVATLCLERIKMLGPQGPAGAEQVEWCGELLCQLIAFLYLEPRRTVMQRTDALLAWPARGLTHSLDLLPPWFRERHRDDAAELFQMEQAQLCARCAQICRGQILAKILQTQPFDLYAGLHEQIYIWFIQNDWSGAQTGATPLQPGLFDIVDYSSSTHKRPVQPFFLEQYLQRLTSESENAAAGGAPSTSMAAGSTDDRLGDFHQAVETLCAFYESTGQFGKAARKFWTVATAPRSLPLAVRIGYMQKAIAIQRRSTTTAAPASDNVLADQSASMVIQAEASQWPKFLTVAQLQLDAVNALGLGADRPDDIAGAGTPVRSRSDSADIADDTLLSLEKVIEPLHLRLRQDQAAAAARAGAIARLLIRCYDTAEIPAETRQQLAPYICQLWAVIIDNGALSFRWKVIRCVSALTYLCRLCRIACRLVRRVVGCAGEPLPRLRHRREGLHAGRSGRAARPAVPARTQALRRAPPCRRRLGTCPPAAEASGVRTHQAQLT